jgi:hypothetical protein
MPFVIYQPFLPNLELTLPGTHTEKSLIDRLLNKPARRHTIRWLERQSPVRRFYWRDKPPPRFKRPKYIRPYPVQLWMRVATDSKLSLPINDNHWLSAKESLYLRVSRIEQQVMHSPS